VKIRTKAIKKISKYFVICIGYIGLIFLSPIFMAAFIVLKFVDFFIVFDNNIWKKICRYIGGIGYSFWVCLSFPRDHYTKAPSVGNFFNCLEVKNDE